MTSHLLERQAENSLLEDRDNMCYFEHITYRCGHQVYHRFAYCHVARNDPLHICAGVKQLKREWAHPRDNCTECVQVAKSEGKGGGGGI